MRFVKLTIAYDGAAYFGWQLQPNGPSVQSVLENAWSSLTGEKAKITASGRTDSGVHATGQVCSVRTNSRIPILKIAAGLNAHLPADVVVTEALEMPTEFHAIRDAIWKTYHYQIQSGPVHQVLERGYWWFVPPSLDAEAMQQGANFLVGKHDFAAFQTSGSERLSTIRNIIELNVESRIQTPYQWIRLQITADGFLYNMVRCIAGSLVEVGKRKHPPVWIQHILESGSRKLAGPTAPAHGLCLVRVEYPPQFM